MENEILTLVNDGRLNRVMFTGIEVDEGFATDTFTLTEPGLCLTVAEVLDRFTHGRPLPDGYEHNRQYTSTSGSSDVLPMMQKGFDLCDLPKVQRYLKQQIADANSKLSELKSSSHSVEDEPSEPVEKP